MYFKFQCPSCDRSLKVSTEMAGSKRVCPYCRNTLLVPNTPAPAAPAPQKTGAAAIDTGRRNVSSAPSVKTGGKAAGGAPASGAVDQAISGNVSLLTSGLIGLACAIALFAALYPLYIMNIRIGKMFWDSIGINFPTTLLMFWSFAILGLKWRQVSQQRSAMLVDLLPSEISEEITISSLDKFVEHIRSLPARARRSILVNRVLRGIEHFRVRKSAAETVTMMESQSGIDASNVAGSYTILKVFIWAMPILGFIGTVMGVSSAVSGLSATLENAADVSAVTSSMKGVFGGLGTAFDTTLLALIMSMIVKIPTSAMQKSEDGLVTIADEYCNENLLRRLNDGREGGAERGSGGSGVDAAVFREAVEAAMGTHHAELENWLKKLDAIGSKLTNQVARGWSDISAKMQEQQQQQVATFQEQAASQTEQLQQQLEAMTEATVGIQEKLTSLTAQAEALQDNVNASVSTSADTLQSHFEGVERGLTSLNNVLESLGENQVVVQQVEPPRRGWFGMRRNGK